MNERTYTQQEWDAQAAEYHRLHAFHHLELSRRSGVIYEQEREAIRAQRRIAHLARVLEEVLDEADKEDGVPYDKIDRARAALKSDAVSPEALVGL